MTFIKRADLGRPLTWDELDSNFEQVDSYAAAASASASAAQTQAGNASQSASQALQSQQAAEAAAASAEGTVDVLRDEIADPDGATTYPDLQMARWRDDGDIRGWGALEGSANSSITTTAMNAAYSARSGKKVIIPPGEWYISDTINAGYSRTTTIAFGAKIFSTFDGVMFDLNPDANPSSIDGANSKAYIKWFGGEFQCIALTLTQAVAFRCYGIRQVTIEYCIFGNSGTIRLNSGIMIAGLGGHNISQNRFLLVNTCIDCPQWATSSTDTAGPITTSCFIANNFILGTGQKAFYVRGGWNRWLIQGGFVNGSGAPVFHFTNYADSTTLNIIGVGFEQALTGGKFIYIQDTSSRSTSSINVSGSTFNGDPTGGGHTAIELERCINVSIGDGTRVEGSTARSNFSVRCDANCADIVIDPSCRLPDPGVSITMPRAQITMGKTFQRISELNLSGYNGDAKSSGTVTLDMKTLIGGSYPRQLPPLAYDLIVQCRDSGSATSTTTQVEVSKNTGSATTRAIIDLRGVPNDTRMGGSIHVNAETDGSIVLVMTASGAGTLDIWIYVTGIYN